MINTKYYDGFEGEHKIVLSDGENRMSIWDGYFDTIMDALLKGNPEKKGIIREYFYREGWYDDPWRIEDIPLTIKQLEAFDINHAEGTENMKKVAPELLQDIILFLEIVEGQVFIEYD